MSNLNNKTKSQLIEVIGVLEEKLNSHPIITYSQIIPLIILVDLLNPLAIIKTPWFYYTKNFWDKFATHYHITANEVLEWKLINSEWKRWSLFSLIISIVIFQHCFPNRAMKIRLKITKLSHWFWSKTFGKLDCNPIDLSKENI